MYKVSYVDDDFDTDLSEHLSNKYGENYCEFNFKSTTKYQDLLSFLKSEEINILIIDSRLFENDTSGGRRFTGDEFLVILKMIYPYIETILVSANKVENKITVEKYNHLKWRTKEKYFEYFDETLKIAENHVDFLSSTMTDLNNSSDIDSVLKEKIHNTFEKISEYRELGKDDIDELIKKFQEIEDKINGGL